MSKDKLLTLMIECESRSTEGERLRGYYQWVTTIRGSQAAYYAQIEYKRLKKLSMWCELRRADEGFVIWHGYDSGD